MLMRTDPFRDLDRLSQQLLGAPTRPSAMPMDAYRKEDNFLIQFDLPGVDPESIELTVDQNVLTVAAERRAPAVDGVEAVISERPQGRFTRQVFLGDTLDPDRTQADYSAGVLTLTMPVAEHAKPRRIEINADQDRQQINA